MIQRDLTILSQPLIYILLELHISLISLITYKPSTLIISPQTFSMQLGASTSLFCLSQCTIPFCTLSLCISQFCSVSLRDLKIKVTSLHFLSEYFIDSTPLVAQFDTSVSTLNSLFRSGATNIGLVVKTLFSSLNVFCCSSPHRHFLSFLVSTFIGLATQAKSLINLLQ